MKISLPVTIRVLFLCLFVLFGRAASAQELSAAETTSLLKRLEQQRAKAPSLTADFTEEKVTHLLSRPLVTQGTLAFQTPNKFRREIKGSNPSMTVSNGKKLWIYYPKFKKAELYMLGQSAFFDEAIAALTTGLDFHEVTDFYRIAAHRDGERFRITLTPKSGGVKRMLRTLTVWMDDDLQLTRTEATLPKGDRLVTAYRNQRPTPLPASTFEFTRPADVDVTQPLGK